MSKRALVGGIESLTLSPIPSFEIDGDFHKKKNMYICHYQIEESQRVPGGAERLSTNRKVLNHGNKKNTW